MLVSESGGEAGVTASAIKRIHMEVPSRWVRQHDARWFAKASPTADEIDSHQLSMSQVLCIGEIVLALMYDDTTQLSWLDAGATRPLTLTFCVGLLGGDTVPKLFGFGPRSGLEALVFAQEAIGTRGILVGDFETENSSAITKRIAVEIIKATHYLKRPSLYDTGALDPAAWVKNATLLSIGQTVFENDATPRLQVSTESQISWLAMKMDARLTEWSRAAHADTKLIHGPKQRGCWGRAASQLKAMRAVKSDGSSMPVGTVLTHKNMQEQYGEGPDLDAMAEAAVDNLVASMSGAGDGASGPDPIVRTNEQLSLISLAQLQQKPTAGGALSHPHIKANIQARDATASLGASYAASGQILFDLVQRGVQPAQPMDGATGAAAAASSNATASTTVATTATAGAGAAATATATATVATSATATPMDVTATTTGAVQVRNNLYNLCSLYTRCDRACA